MDFAANGLVDSVFLHDVDSLAWYLADFFKDNPKATTKSSSSTLSKTRKRTDTF